MARRTWQGLAGVFTAALLVMSCSGTNPVGLLAVDGGPGTDASTRPHDGGSTDSTVDGPTDALVVDTGCDGLCGDGVKCSIAADCQSGVCTGGACQAPSPTDGVKNDSETGVDCGGSSSPTSDGAPACPLGETCIVGSDCLSTSCQAGKCVAPTCTDKIKDGTETDVDCGGNACAGCATGGACLVATDCVSDVCTNQVCAAPSSTDGVKNDSETAVDCGGGFLASGAANPASDGAPVCATGQTCLLGTDCAQGVCAVSPASPDAGASDAAGSDGGAPATTCQPASPTDGVKNDSETDVDCGGALLASGAANPASDGAPACGAGMGCVIAQDCASLVCTNKVCVAPSATDGVKNDSETAIDCGGGLLASGAANPASDGAPACADGQSCLLGTDCLDLVCATGPLSAPSAGGAPVNCPAGQTCTCQKPTKTDGIKNDSETDIDCGGALLVSGAVNTASDGAPVCVTGKGCLLGLDCGSLVCANGVVTTPSPNGAPIDCPAGQTCTCQAPTKTDGVKNDSETGIDCGGGTTATTDGAPACADGKGCLLGFDCVDLVCATGVVTTPSPNGAPINCPAGSTCTCQKATFTDGVKNDSELNVDCGGAFLSTGAANPASDGAPGCADDLACATDKDCLSGFCSTLSNKCVAGLSCKGVVTPAQILNVTGTNADGDATGTPNANGAGQHAGIDTCGKGESTDPVAQQAHESCCRSLLVPGLGTCSATKACAAGETCVAGNCEMRLDKYEVTAGRVRQFVEAVNTQMLADATHNPNGYLYDIRDWATAQVAANTTVGKTLAAQIPAAEIALLPQNYYGALNVIEQLGGTTMDANFPSQVQGCYTYDGAAGASTYYWPESSPIGLGLAQVGSQPRPFTQDYYDIKSMNCAPYWVYAAFCAWDGGYLPTLAQVETAYGTAQYPWGATFIPNYGALNTTYVTAGGNPIIPQPAVNNTVNWCNDSYSNHPGDFYFYPNGGGLGQAPSCIGTGRDYSPFIAAPGRFFLDVTALKSPSYAGTEGWQDLGANMMEITALTALTGGATSTFCDCGATNNGETNNCTCPAPGSTPPTKPGVIRATGVVHAQWSGGSWEGHSNNAQPESKPYFGAQAYGGFPLQTQYGKAGFRCARPAE